jgi:hypothetical protein
LLAAHAGFRLLFLVDAGTTVVYALITFARVAETQSRATPVGSRVPVLVADRALLGVVLLNACFAIVSFQGQSTLPIASLDTTSAAPLTASCSPPGRSHSRTPRLRMPRRSPSGASVRSR